MGFSHQEALALEYEEHAGLCSVSCSQKQSTSTYPSFSQVWEANNGLAPSMSIQFRCNEQHCTGKRRMASLGFARVSLSTSMDTWEAGALGEFMRESSRRSNQVFRSVPFFFPLLVSSQQQIQDCSSHPREQPRFSNSIHVSCFQGQCRLPWASDKLNPLLGWVPHFCPSLVSVGDIPQIL